MNCFELRSSFDLYDCLGFGYSIFFFFFFRTRIDVSYALASKSGLLIFYLSYNGVCLYLLFLRGCCFGCAKIYCCSAVLRNL